MRTPSIADLRAIVWVLVAAVAVAAPLALAGCEQKPAPPPETPKTAPPTEAQEKPAAPAEEKEKPAPKPDEKAPPAEKDSPAAPAEKAPEKPAEEKAAAEDEGVGWESVFDGKTLGQWKSTPFGGEGKVYVKDGQIILEMASADLTGITWAGKVEDLPKIDYEISLEAMRADGSDFFCGLTFPYKDSHASLICGGWGGGLVGISSFDNMDASQNETSSFYQFENNRWYRIRLRVTEGSMQAWIDGKRVVNADVRDRKVGVRMEVDASRPLGIATWHTKGALRNIKMRRVF